VTSEEKYAWLGKLPGMKKWIGERVVNQLAQHDYALVNEDYEDTVGVPRNDIEDDKYGVYAPLFALMGNAVAAHPDEVVWPLLKNAFDDTYGLCYDGQYLIDSDHPVLDADGKETSVSNDGGGSGTAWFLAELKGRVKPLIFQRRKRADNIVRLDADTDEPVFRRNEIEYGVHCRDVAGYGWWQGIYGSKQTLDAGAYETARQKMIEFKGDYGRPLGIMPDTLIVPPSLEGEARRIVGTDRKTGGATNEWYNTAEVLMVPWLA